MSTNEAHYAGGLVAGAQLMELFGDAATEVLIRNDGDEGLFVAYDMVEFKVPVHVGDYLEVYGTLEEEGNTSRKLSFEAYKVIDSQAVSEPSAAEPLEEPVLVAQASGTCVVPKERQRKNC
jgi:3-aminobutyryl-CoA ammonia-lyase